MPYLNPYVDWNNYEEVLLVAATLSKKTGQSIIKRAGRTNYNIIHTSNETRLLKKGDKVLWRSK